MSVNLLDVNILIPLIQPAHAFAHVTKAWFEQINAEGWATCPQTENGLIRIMSGPKYPTPSNDPVYYAGLLQALTQVGDHHFWPDDISSRDVLNTDMRLTSKDFPDLYLLALAIEHGGKFASFDAGIPAHLLPGGVNALEVIRA